MNDNYMKTILSGVKEWTENLTDDAKDKANNALDKANNALDKANNALDKALFVVNITQNSGGTISADKTFEEIVQAYNEGKYSIVLKYGFEEGEAFEYSFLRLDAINPDWAHFISPYHMGAFDNIGVLTAFIYNNNTIKLTDTELAQVPTPYPLTFTGAVNETYDGSSAKTITIPSGGGGEKEWRLLRTISIAEAVASVSISQDDNGNAFEVEDIFIYAPKDVITSANTQLIVRFNDDEGKSSSLNDFLGTTAKSLFYESYWSGMRVSRMGSTTYDFARVAGNAAIVGLNAAPQKINKIDLTLQGSTTFTAGTFYIYAR